MANEQIASQVLDYWFAIEFLGQDSYDTCTDEAKLTRELIKYKKSDASEKKRRKQIPIFEKVDGTKEIYSMIIEQSKSCEMFTWGNLTFYIGKIRRQSCIEKLANELGISLEQAEKNSEFIPVLSFQCSNRGVYVEHSLSLSTIVWALSQVSGKKNAQISELLSDKAYLETLEKLEKNFFNPDNSEKLTEINENVSKREETVTPEFEDGAISVGKIKNIYSELVRTYGKYIGDSLIEKSVGIKYQLFKDSKVKNKYDDDNYMGLSHDFFSKDLKMIKNKIEDGRLDFKTGMLSNLIEYICAPYDVFKERERHDFVKPKNEDVFFEEMSEILNIKNAPLGKWPSRYMPALMQQVAINFAISNRKRGIFDKNGNIFSVNGPPGTGKTTLLKEVIASNIVEKAIILSKYDTPDDAFEGVKFVHGELNGAYAQYYPKWFRFKDDCIANYGVLVTSCNNAAVENITKELPMGSGILDNLKPGTDSNHPDSAEMQEQLREIHKLFSVSDTDKKITIYQKDSKRQGEYPEIYFTGYAQKFLGSDEEDADAWGLVAAPLGKKSNISEFYYDVLNPVWQDFLIKNQFIEERVPQYQEVKKSFCVQLNKVQMLQEQLGKYGDAVLKAHQAYITHKNTKQTNTKFEENVRLQIENLENEIKGLQLQMENEEEKIGALVSKCSEIECRIKECEQKIEGYSDQELEYRKQASDAENSVTLLTRVFRKSKYESALGLAQMYRVKAQECKDASLEVMKTLNSEKTKYEKEISEKDFILQQLEDAQNEIELLENRKGVLEKEINHLEAEIENSRRKAAAAEEKRNELLSAYNAAGDIKRGQVLDETFIKNVLSKDESVSTDAQTSNPWATEEFNREREKLFYLALQMTKEFLLSSKSCRANLCILGQYWGLRTESGTDKIKFHSEDSEAMIGSLFNTLFLLTPVISSTFASVGRLLKDIKEPGVIGTLIIDEAGQAQPQMAVGAMVRSRKAIIVGDPRQVEPVVTDDLKLLKEAYSEPVFANYKNKSLSVQSCADILNPFGTFFDNGTDYPEWVGCPLLVHRRCIAPMYEISNRISYDGIMRQQTLPPSESKEATFLSNRSQWINVPGTETGNGDHYVPAQGEVVCNMVDEAFKRAETPNLYIITPFTSVVHGIRSALRVYSNKYKESALAKSRTLGDWLFSNVGTVHKFQGKEANEVIFLLGCDESQKDKYAVKGFVNSNIVNVAATRAKYRFYMVGNLKVWHRNQYINEAKAIIDTLPIEKIAEIECWEDSENKSKELLNQAVQLPGVSSFMSRIGENEEGEPEMI